MNESDIKQLINRCLEGNPVAQKQLYKGFYGRAMGICLRYSNNRYEAKDIINQGFMKVFTSLHRYDDQKPFGAWLSKIMINTAIDHYRRQLRFSHFEDLDAAEQAKVDPEADVKLNYDDLLIMVQQLSVGYRTVFNLYAIEEYSHEEISKILDISIGTSKSNLFKARLKLRDMIAKTYSLKRGGVNKPRH